MGDLKVVLFDIYGTLIDIHTEEHNDNIFEALSRFLHYRRIYVSGKEIKELFLAQRNQQFAKSRERYPEVDITQAFGRVLKEHGGTSDQYLNMILTQLYRSLCRNHFRPYNGTFWTLNEFRKRYRLGIISDAQRLFCNPELPTLRIEDFFDATVISSGYGFRKPDPRLFHIALAALNVKPSEAAYIGNKYETDLLVLGILLVVLMGFSAFFSGCETALMAISRLRLKHLAQIKPTRVRIVERVLSKPERLIGTILLGNNLVNVAMSAIATAIAISILGEKGIVYVMVLLTFAVLIFGEITPKVYAKYFSEPVSFTTAPILNVIMFIFKPVVFAVTYLSNRILFLFGFDVSKIEKPLMSEDEILTCIKIGWSDGNITSEERKMLSRVFMLNDKTIGDVMVPKERIVSIDADASLEEIYEIILTTGHTRFPIKGIGNSGIIGFIHHKGPFPVKG